MEFCSMRVEEFWSEKEGKSTRKSAPYCAIFSNETQITVGNAISLTSAVYL